MAGSSKSICQEERGEPDIRAKVNNHCGSRRDKTVRQVIVPASEDLVKDEEVATSPSQLNVSHSAEMNAIRACSRPGRQAQEVGHMKLQRRCGKRQAIDPAKTEAEACLDLQQILMHFSRHAHGQPSKSTD